MFTVYTLIKVCQTLHLAALWGSTLKRKNLLLLEQIHSFKSRPQLGRASLPRKANRKSQKSFSFIEMVEKDGGVPNMINGYCLRCSFLATAANFLSKTGFIFEFIFCHDLLNKCKMTL